MLRCQAIFISLLGLGFSLGCGPVEYLSHVSGRASHLLAQARADGATEKAPYEFTKAELYLTMARDDAGRGHFQSAVEWGKRSQDCSRRALALTKVDSARVSASGATRPQQTCGVP